MERGQGKGKMMKALVVGFGSIGKRHARILKELGCEVGVVSHREVGFSPRYKNLGRALKDFSPGYVVVANRTSEHLRTLKKLRAGKFKGVVMVEKPLFSNAEKFPASGFRKIVVGYNLRFHPLIRNLRKLLRGQKILTVQAYVGKNLAAWRPGVDYKKSYSAIKNQGGGVLRDLSHELDYVIWLLGGWRSVAAVGGHYSRLKIETDDIFSLMIKTRCCDSVFVHMNYVDPVGHRTLMVNAAKTCIRIDLMNHWIEVNGKRKNLLVDRDFTYLEEHRAVLAGQYSRLCSFVEGVEVMRLIAAAEKSAKNEKWVHA
ncbi:MAG: Gfo/Idh/MocA family oxidoreductase [Candidatus Omnitrophota bacterium]